MSVAQYLGEGSEAGEGSDQHQGQLRGLSQTYPCSNIHVHTSQRALYDVEN